MGFQLLFHTREAGAFINEIKLETKEGNLSERARFTMKLNKKNTRYHSPLLDARFHNLCQWMMGPCRACALKLHSNARVVCALARTMVALSGYRRYQVLTCRAVNACTILLNNLHDEFWSCRNTETVLCSVQRKRQKITREPERFSKHFFFRFLVYCVCCAKG